MQWKRFFMKLALTFGLAACVYSGANAAAPRPKLTPVFNNATALPQQVAKEYRLPSLKEPTPEEAKDLWRIRVGAWQIGAGGYHTFLEFSPYSQNDKTQVGKQEVYQLHGIATDEVRHTWAQLYWRSEDAYTRYFHGDYILKAMGVIQDHKRTFFHQTPVAYVDVYYGTKDDVLKKYLDGMQVAKRINSTNDPYILLEHNSNSAQHSYSQALGLPSTPLFVEYRAAAIGGRIWTPGINESLLPKDFDMAKIRENSDYKNMTTKELEDLARKLSGPDNMFATFRTPKPREP